MPAEVWDDEDRMVEKFRRTQVEWFIRNREFRNRYMKLCVWETSALRTHLTNEQFRCNPVAGCWELEESIDRFSGLVRGESQAIKEIPNTICLKLLFYIALTSREDLLVSTSEVEIFKTYTEWHDWFKNNKTRLIQRNDMIGWTALPAGEARRSDSPGAGIVFPLLAIPDLTIGDLHIRKPELRRNFSYEVR